MLQRPLDRLTERTEARFVLEDALVPHSTDTLALIGIGQRGARAIDDVLLQFFIRCTQRCRASSFDFVVCHQVRWHGVRGVDFRLTLPLVTRCFCSRAKSWVATLFFWFVGSDFGELLS